MNTLDESYNKTICPLCGAEMEYKNIGTEENPVHKYGCPECPFLGIEYYFLPDVETLHKHLEKQE